MNGQFAVTELLQQLERLVVVDFNLGQFASNCKPFTVRRIVDRSVLVLVIKHYSLGSVVLIGSPSEDTAVAAGAEKLLLALLFTVHWLPSEGGDWVLHVVVFEGVKHVAEHRAQNFDLSVGKANRKKARVQAKFTRVSLTIARFNLESTRKVAEFEFTQPDSLRLRSTTVFAEKVVLLRHFVGLWLDVLGKDTKRLLPVHHSVFLRTVKCFNNYLNSEARARL